MLCRLIALFSLFTPLLCIQAKDLMVRIDYDTTHTTGDGVTRVTRYSDQLIRRNKDSWQVRIMSTGAHSEEDHHRADKGHKHMDIHASARWITRMDDGKLQVRLVNAHDKLVIDIPKTEYSNIGFDGDWNTASQIIATEQVKKMKAIDAPAPTGNRWYETRRGNLTVRVLWDEQQEFPRKIESFSSNGLYSSTVTATPQAMPTTMPWTQLKTYGHKEYADFLD